MKAMTKISLVSDERDVRDQVALVSSVYIIKDGVPLFSRCYTSFHESQDPMLICGFVSAVLAFAETTMEQEVLDIGLTNERLYFLKSNRITYVATRANYLFKDLNLAIEHSLRLLENIRDSFQLLHQLFSIQPGAAVDTSDFESFRVTLDSLVLEQTMELEFSLEGKKEVKELASDAESYLPEDYGRDVSDTIDQSSIKRSDGTITETRTGESTTDHSDEAQAASEAAPDSQSTSRVRSLVRKLLGKSQDQRDPEFPS